MKEIVMIKGSMVALVTPMRDGRVDLEAFESLIDWHIAEGTHALVVLGTTGESVTVTMEERDAIVRHVVGHVKGRVPVVVGTGSNATDHAIALTQHAKEAGADACLLVSPYYNKPSQQGLLAHFGAVADAVAIPQILYNVPGRTGGDLLSATAATLAEHDHIVGLKDATADWTRVLEMMEVHDNPMALYSGDDMTSMAFMALGGVGTISVTANIMPGAMAKMAEAVLAGDMVLARAINKSLRSLHADLFVDANPVPVKWLLAHMGKIPSSEVRLPLVSLSEDKHDCLIKALERANSYGG
jgi:4-hydroxy-tetrahydrodipicolinate synthase